MISCKHKTCQDDLRRRFCDKQRDSIINWHKKGWDINRIAKKFDTNYMSIKQIISKSFKKQQYHISNRINQDRYHTDKEFKEKVKKNSREIMRARYWDDPVYRKCKIEQVTQRHQKKKILIRL